MIKITLVLILSVIVSISIIPADAEINHIGIKLDSTCEKLINLGNSDTCPSYEEIGMIIENTEFRAGIVDHIDNLEKSDRIKTDKIIEQMKFVCIRDDSCHNFIQVRENQTAMYWHDPAPNVYPYLDLIMISANSKIISKYHVSQETIIEASKTIKELLQEKGESEDTIEENEKRIEELEIQKTKLIENIDSKKVDIRNIEIKIRDAEIWKAFEGSEEADNPQKYEEEIDEKEEEIDEMTNELNQIKKEISTLGSDQGRIKLEIREIGKEINSNKERILPSQKITDAGNTREITWNVNQLYVDRECGKAIFKPEQYIFELGPLIQYMIKGCNDASLLSDVFNLNRTDTIEKHELDITTSPNYQYRQWLEAAKTDCKLKC